MCVHVDGPSLVAIEVSPLIRAGSAVPLSPPMKTTGLTGIRLELRTPVVAQVSVLIIMDVLVM